MDSATALQGDNDNHFLEHLTSELSLPSQEEAAPLVSSVIEAFCQTLSSKNEEALRERLPEFLKRYFIGRWKEENQIQVEHLDELVTLVMERDKKNVKHLFKSEIQTLSVILFTLKKLFSVIDPAASGFSVPFYREVKEASFGMSI